MQQKITLKKNLLQDNGKLELAGYADNCIYYFNKENIKASPFRTKEWDFYQISDEKFCVQMTIGHVSYAGTTNATLFTLDGKERYDFTLPLLLPFDRLKLEKNAQILGKTEYCTKKYKMSFEVQEDFRLLNMVTHTKKYGNIKFDIALKSNIDDKGIMIATPFWKENEFYFNYKINCMKASGRITIGEKVFEFSQNAYGLLDWGRGILPYKHTWWWGNGSTTINGKLFGFNIGEFGNNKNATENMLFFDGKADKLNNIVIEKDYNFLGEWIFSSDDKRFEMEFTPVFDNFTHTKFLFVDNSCNQVFGKFNGYVVFEKEKLEIKDMLAFCEFADNKW